MSTQSTRAARRARQSHAVSFAAEGADVLALDVASGDGAAALADTVRLVEGRGRHIVARQVDVRDGQALEDAFAEGVETLGRLHAAIVNAGVVRLGGCLDVSEEDWRLSLDVNLTGA